MKLICSVWPFEQKAIRPTFRPQSQWTLKACGDDDVATLAVDSQVESDYAGNDRWIDRADATTDAKIADDLVNQFRSGKGVQGMAPTAGPGIWIHPNPQASVAQIKASPEYAAARAELNELAVALLEQGNVFHENRRAPDIERNHRWAARYLRQEHLAWVNVANREKGQACRFCNQAVHIGAMVCPHCSNVIDVERYAREKAILDQAIAASMKPREEVPLDLVSAKPKPGQPIQQPAR